MAYRRWYNHLSDENDGNENGVDAIVCDYELFMLFRKRGKKYGSHAASRTNAQTNERMEETNELKKVVLKSKYNIWELHGKAIKNICTVVVSHTHIWENTAVDGCEQQSSRAHSRTYTKCHTDHAHTQSTHEITVNEVHRRFSTFFLFFNIFQW